MDPSLFFPNCDNMVTPQQKYYAYSIMKNSIVYGTRLYQYWFGTPTSWGQMRAQAIAGGLNPLLSALYSVRDTENKYSDYYKNQPYAGFPKYPSSTDLYHSWSSFANSGLNFVSSNVHKMYRN